MDVPGDLSSLKRAALQALAKKHGIKANGKNTDIIRSLEELRDNQRVENTPPVETVKEVLDNEPEAVKPAAKKRRGRPGKKRPNKRKTNEAVENCSLTGGSDNASTDEATPITTTPLLRAESPHTASPAVEAPFSPPPTEGSSRKRKRNSTFTISDESALATPTQTEGVGDSKSEFVAMETGPGPITSPDEKRRLTFNKTPPAKKSKTDSADSADFMAELQSHLDNKVKEVQSAPGYKPVHSASTAASRSITMSQIKRKFERAHSKQFNKMKSIADDRKRKAAAPETCPAKRPRLSEKQVPTSKRPQATVAKKPLNNSGKVFKPTVLSVKNADLKFSSDKSANKTTGSKLKTPKKVTIPIPAAAVKRTPITQSKKPVYNLVESLKKKPKYKPHTGPLPKFGYTYTK